MPKHGIMKERTKYQLTIFYFFSLGLWMNFPPAVVTWIAVEDILAGTLWSSTLVIVLYSIPEIIAKVLSPYVINKMISFRSAFALITLLLVGSYTLLVAIDDVRIRMAVVCVLGGTYGFSAIIAVRMLSYYEHADVHANAFQNGTNASVFAASLVYTGMTTWICLAPRIVMAVCIPFCFLPLVIYFLLDKEPLKDHLMKTTNRQSVQYTALNGKEYSKDDNETPKPISEQDSIISFFFKAFPFMGYAYFTNFCIHFIMTAVLTTLTFESAPFQPRDHFQYYRFANDIGALLGGVVHLLFSSCDTKWSTEFFRIRRIWVLGLLDVFHLFFFVFASWHRFLPNIDVVLVMCVTQGILSGLILVQCAANSANTFTSASDKGTALGLMEIGLSLGRIAAALLGISTEKFLREHCTDRLMLGRFCLARHASSAEWNNNLSCKKT